MLAEQLCDLIDEHEALAITAVEMGFVGVDKSNWEDLLRYLTKIRGDQ